MRTTLKRVQRMGRLIEVAPDQFFLSETVAEMAGIAAGIARGGSRRHGDRRGVSRPAGERQEGGDPGAGVLRPRRRHRAHRRRAAGARGQDWDVRQPPQGGTTWFAARPSYVALAHVAW